MYDWFRFVSISFCFMLLVSQLLESLLELGVLRLEGRDLPRAVQGVGPGREGVQQIFTERLQLV